MTSRCTCSSRSGGNEARDDVGDVKQQLRIGDEVPRDPRPVLKDAGSLSWLRTLGGMRDALEGKGVVVIAAVRTC
jgi:hypothetical protein